MLSSELFAAINCNGNSMKNTTDKLMLQFMEIFSLSLTFLTANVVLTRMWGTLLHSSWNKFNGIPCKVLQWFQFHWSQVNIAVLTLLVWIYLVHDKISQRHVNS